ncbi:hypothetical protein ACX1G6_11090 [Yersinia enterocolitica]
MIKNEEIIKIAKEKISHLMVFFQKNPHLGPAIFLFLLGTMFLTTKNFTAVAGALFGAGASLLGAWISDFNSQKKESLIKTKQESEARGYFIPELTRIIKRVIYIQERAIINYSITFGYINKNIKSGLDIANEIKEPIKTGDLKEDFMPYLPRLYPNAPQFKELSGKDATSLIAFYDSLFEIELLIKDWWKREGQLEANLFNMIAHNSEKSLSLALECLTKLEIENFNDTAPPKDSLTYKILLALKRANETRERMFNAFQVAKNLKS